MKMRDGIEELLEML